MKKLKSVTHIVPAPFSEKGVIGGAERYALELAKAMARQVPTTLLTFGDEAHQENIGPLKFKVLKVWWRVKGRITNPISPLLLGQILRADVVHCHQLHTLTSSLTAICCRLLGKRCFVSDLGGGGWGISSYIPTERWYRGHLHISRYSRKIAGQEGRYWSHIIMGGVDSEKFAPANPEGDATDGVVRFVGRILPHKGIDDLINAMPADLPLEIIGRPYKEDFYAHLQKLAEGKNVKFRLDCGDEELVEAYRTALCVVLPSVYTNSWNGNTTQVPELLGQTLLEAMACGVPAICTDVASMPEVVEDGVTGFVVPPNDPSALGAKLQWLHDNSAERDQMGRAARQRVLKHFTWESVVERCLESYKN